MGGISQKTNLAWYRHTLLGRWLRKEEGKNEKETQGKKKEGKDMKKDNEKKGEKEGEKEKGLE